MLGDNARSEAALQSASNLTPDEHHFADAHSVLLAVAAD